MQLIRRFSRQGVEALVWNYKISSRIIVEFPGTLERDQVYSSYAHALDNLTQQGFKLIASVESDAIFS